MDYLLVNKVESIKWIKKSPQIEIRGYAYIQGIDIKTEEKVKKSIIIKNNNKEFVLPVKNILREDISSDEYNYNYAGFSFIIESSFIDDMKPLSDGKWSIELYLNVDGVELIAPLIVSNSYINIEERIINYTKKNTIYKIKSIIDDKNRLYLYSESEKVKLMKLKVFKFKMKKKIIKSKMFNYFSLKILNIIYKIFSKMPIKDNGVAFLSDNAAHMANFTMIYEKLKSKDIYDIRFICKTHLEPKKSLSEKIRSIYYLATYKTIFLNDAYPLLNKVKPREGIRIVQLWHAPGAFKKFGFSRSGKPQWKKNIEKRKNHRTYTHAIVSSKNIIYNYAEAYRISANKIIPTGIPRTDVFFDEEYKNNKIDILFNKYPILKHKKIILFAPTYRGKDRNGYYDFEKMDMNKIRNELGDEYILVIKLHKFISNSPKWGKEYSDFIVDLSNDEDIIDLFFIADLLITDYSSVVFEYSLLNKPILFFAYDLDNYISNRDFYYPYENFVPGPIVKSTEDMINTIKENKFELDKLNSFRNKFFDHFDGKSTQRVIDMLFDY